MSSGKRDFFGKEVPDAIRDACKKMRVPQEELDIEVVETGSMGIFGLIRKKAHIRVFVKALTDEFDMPEEVSGDVQAEEAAPPEPEKKETEAAEKKETSAAAKPSQKKEEPKKKNDEAKKKAKPEPKPTTPILPESVEVVREQLAEILRLMGFESDVTAVLDGATVRCQVDGEHEEALTGQDGKIIDSLQYLLRKVIARKVEEKVRLSIDVGEYRERRKVELAERAKELAEMVKEDGKTQAIPPLNPSERRVVHVALQEDKDIRSRSVGDGLFKKVLIYKPGKGKKPAGKRGGKGKRGKGGGKKKQESSES